MSYIVIFSFLCFFECYGDHRHLHLLTHSFPTRRSSDLCRQELSEFRSERSDRQVAVLSRRDFVNADLAIECGGDHELGPIMNGIARASRLDVGFDRRRTEPEDPRDVGVALALPGQDHAFALARLQPDRKSTRLNYRH